MQVSLITLPTQFNPGVYAPFLDTTGVNAANLVTGEEQTFEQNPDSAYTFVMPSFGPFFANSLVAKVKNNVGVFVDMTLGVDYYFAFPFLGASRALNEPVFAGIRLLGIVQETVIQLRYQCLGGDWILGQAANAAILAAELRNPCAVAFEQVANHDRPFPVITLEWDRQDPTKLDAVNDAVDAITENASLRYAELDYQPQIAHIVDLDNPHQTTKAQANLGLVSDLPPASDESAKDVLNNVEYINTAQVHAMMVHGMTHATDTVRGVSKLNLGTAFGDDIDSENALTATGFTTITSNPESAINKAYNKGQLSKSVSPFPFAYPVTWNGGTYADQESFVAAVENFVEIFPLEYNSNNGVFWFPANTELPDLSVS